MSEFNYKKDVEINPNQLDLEWLRQPALYQKYAGEAAYARDRRDRAKDKLEVVKAQVDGDVRQNPGNYGFTGDKKPTEGAITSAVIQSEGYQEANEEYLKSKLECDIIQSAVLAMEQRKYALENLVKLLNSSYFASPSVPRDLSAEWQKTVEQTKGEQQAEVAEKMGERRRRRE